MEVNPQLQRSSRWAPARAIVVTLAVLGTMALALRTADAFPRWMAGIPAGVRLCNSLEQAAARTALPLDRMSTTAFADYQVAADGIRVTTTPLRAAAVAMRRPGGDHIVLTLFRSHGGEIPQNLRKPLPAFHEIAVQLQPGCAATLKAEALPDGSVWQDLEWQMGPDRLALRFNGRTVELLGLARHLVKDWP
jgi:hypothetical protein